MISLYTASSPYILFIMMLQLFFSCITGLLTLLSYRIYRIVKSESSMLMFIAFCSMALSYGLQFIFNGLRYINLPHESIRVMGIHPFAVLDNQGLFLHVLFMTLGITLLMFTTFRNRSKKLLAVLLFPSVLMLFFSKHLLQGFFIITSFYLAICCHHYYLNYQDSHSSKKLVIAIAFAFLLIGQLEFLFIWANPTMYVIAHIFDAIAYGLLLYNYVILKK